MSNPNNDSFSLELLLILLKGALFLRRYDRLIHLLQNIERQFFCL